MAVPFTVVGIDHVVLRAADPTKLERFYLDALGLTFEKRQGELAQLRAGNALIDIVPADEAGPAGGTSSTGGANLDHLCLRIEPFDQAAITKHLAKHHVACEAETLRYGAEGEGPSIYLRDPEGNGIELKGPASGRWRHLVKPSLPNVVRAARPIANRVSRRSGHHLLPLAAHCWHTSTLPVRRALREQGRI